MSLKFNNTFILIFAFLLIVFVLSCTKKEQNIANENNKFNLSVYIESFCSKSSKNKLINKKFAALKQMIDFYKSIDYKPVWIKNNQANNNFNIIIDLLKQSMNYGLDTTIYRTQLINSAANNINKSVINSQNICNIIITEIYTTNSILLFMNHIEHGILMPDTLVFGGKINEFNDTIPIILKNSLRKNKLIDGVLSVQPKNPHYIAVQKALQKYLKNNFVNNYKYKVPYFAKDSSGCRNGVRQMLIIYGYLKKGELNNDSIKKAIMQFQTEHGLNPRGGYDTLTIETIRNSKYDLYRKAALTLQRLRWSFIKDNNYILVNVPSFTLNLVEDSEIAVTHKVIAGTPDNATPELNSRMSHIILFPDWNVPFKISTKEFLPLIQKDIKYLEKYKYEVIKGKNEIVDPSKIYWKKYTEKNFPYRLRQTSGDHNSLGIIKFYFPNEYGVYLHDTPGKRLFEKNYRAFSHGCMRLQNPYKFAATLLEYKKGISHLNNKNSEQLIEVKKLYEDIKERNKSTFYIQRALPIYVRYFTAFFNDKTELTFYPDMYHKDQQLIDAYNVAVKKYE